ncbi:MAG: hypothetical protein NVSMB42_01180 [Herpetosiphon sp.]
MVDCLVLRLLEEAINSPGKLALALLFADSPQVELTLKQLAQRLCRDPWAIDASINGLLRSNILESHNGKYRISKQSPWASAIAALRVDYDDPFRRDDINTRVREIERYAPYRDEFGPLRERVASV